ncbi:hypothetical protein J2S41_004160 [Catenuloplanes atrovinosus]|uniref:Uncharacterized protein n=1 Tax=Catenuloplanes atrovinosus TaxID=137266 RepID=A0AAE3YRM7_9ACTN|nr:hypothetical protein [Catenuloplanes atrovinosus]
MLAVTVAPAGNVTHAPVSCRWSTPVSVPPFSTRVAPAVSTSSLHTPYEAKSVSYVVEKEAR